MLVMCVILVMCVMCVIPVMCVMLIVSFIPLVSFILYPEQFDWFDFLPLHPFQRVKINFFKSLRGSKCLTEF